MPRQSRFQRGSSTYICHSCGKRTRNVEGEESVELCLLCDTKAMAANVLNEHGFQGDAWAIFEGCRTREQVYAIQTEIMEGMGFA